MKSPACIACILCALIGACASQPKQPPRVVMQGFSIVPPIEKDWVMVARSADAMVMGKAGRFSGETFAMRATIIDLPRVASTEALVKHLESTQRNELDPKRYRVFKREVTQQIVHGQACALSLVDAAERTGAEGTVSPVNVMVETMTLVCPHPQDPLRGIIMAYSHRHFPEDVDPQFSQYAATLIQNLAFEPL